METANEAWSGLGRPLADASPLRAPPDSAPETGEASRPGDSPRRKDLQDERLRRLCEASFEALVLSYKGRIIDANPAAEELFCRTIEDMRGKPLLHIIMPAHRHLITSGSQSCTGQTHEVECIRADGSTFPSTLREKLIESDGRQIRVSAFQNIAERRLQESQMRQTLAEQQAILESLTVGVVFTRARKFVWVNRRLEQMFGYDEGEMNGQSTEIYYQDKAAWTDFGNTIYPALAAGETYTGERWMRRKDGALILCRAQGRAVDADNPLLGAIWLLEDITDQRRAEESLQLTAGVFENSSEGIFVADAERRIIRTNRSFSIITGLREVEVIGERPEFLRSPHQRDDFYSYLWSSVDSLGQWQGEVWITRRSGESVPIWISVNSIRSDRERVAHYVATFSDITERKRIEAHLKFQATHDALTLLPNRILFMDRLESAMQRAQRENGQFAVMFFDLDRFKIINDTLGHHIGDQLLRGVADRLTQEFGKRAVIARMGGDEFMLLLESIESPQHAPEFAQQVVECLQQPFNIQEYEIISTGSVGVCLYPQDGENIETLLKHADSAVYRAKERGRNTFQLFTADINANSLERLSIEQGLRRALEREELFLVYQPQISVATGRMVGMEALIRWRHPTRGLVPPLQFIPLAEETGLIVKIGEWVLRTACRQLAAWRAAGWSDLRVAVNLSGRQFKQHNLLESIDQVLISTGVPPEALELEITESVAMEDAAAAASVLQSLADKGVALSIDDFGTGYSSLAYLKSFPIDTLKIDRSFVRDIDRDPNDAAIARAIIAMAHSLGLKVIAEGVETRSHLEFLRGVGCDEMQGYLFSPPVSPQEVETMFPRIFG